MDLVAKNQEEDPRRKSSGGLVRIRLLFTGHPSLLLGITSCFIVLVGFSPLLFLGIFQPGMDVRPMLLPFQILLAAGLGLVGIFWEWLSSRKQATRSMVAALTGEILCLMPIPLAVFLFLVVTQGMGFQFEP
ncbi:MAG: hypothetical protein JO112_05370 [Planctomycetes bacterium]|nr:hypothetical protein [Planctomycetota bacterium]